MMEIYECKRRPDERPAKTMNLHPGTLWILDRFTRQEEPRPMTLSVRCDFAKLGMSSVELGKMVLSNLNANLAGRVALLHGLPWACLDPRKRSLEVTTTTPEGAETEGTEQ